VAGELAMNTADGKLFFKDSAGVVQTMASKATGAIGGSTTQIQFNNAGVLGGSASLTWSGTVLTSSGFAGPLNGTVGATTPATGAFTTLTTSSTITDNGGTANGVTYLNGSKVVTSGSAIQFDGTRFGVGLTPTANTYLIQSNSGVRAGTSVVAQGTLQGYTGAGIFLSYESTYGRLESYDYGASAWKDVAIAFNGGSVGIGTNSPTKKLDVYSTTQRGQIAMSGSNVVAIRWNTTDPNAGERNWEIINNLDAQGTLSFRVGASQTADPSTTRMVIDSSGNVGIGVTSPTNKLQVAGALSVTGTLGSIATSSLVIESDSANSRARFITAGSNSSTYSNTVFASTYSDGSGYTERARIDSSGNVGIGTSSPSSILNVKANSPVFRLETGGAVGSGAVAYNAIRDSTGSDVFVNGFLGLANCYQFSTTAAAGFMRFLTGAQVEAMRIDSSGNVGIGTSSPAVKLDVQNNGDVTVRSYSTNVSNQAFVQAVNSGGTYIGLLQYGALKTAYGALGAGKGAIYSIDSITLMADNPAGIINFATGGNTERMRIDSSGNVGIGTSSPDYKFQIEGVGTGVTTRMGITNTTTGSTLEIGSDVFGGFLNTTGSYGTLFYTNGSERMRIDSSGYVLIGATSSAGAGDRRLEILSATNTAAGFLLNTTSYNYAGIYSAGDSNIYNYWGTSGSYLFGTANRNTQSFSEKMRIDSSGKVMVNTTNNSGGGRVTIATANGVAGSGLDVTNTSGTAAYFAAAFYNNGTSYAYCGGISVSGTSTSYATSSDYRLKEDIQPMTGALAKVSALKPVTYKWKTDNSYSQGFIAHELQAIVPECVIGEKDAIDENGKPRYQGIDTSFLVATLTAAIQELKAEFDAYKAAHP
jgi:hypothetical protein